MAFLRLLIKIEFALAVLPLSLLWLIGFIGVAGSVISHVSNPTNPTSILGVLSIFAVFFFWGAGLWALWSLFFFHEKYAQGRVPKAILIGVVLGGLGSIPFLIAVFSSLSKPLLLLGSVSDLIIVLPFVLLYQFYLLIRHDRSLNLEKAAILSADNHH